jgi:hypothetical protein
LIIPYWVLLPDQITTLPGKDGNGIDSNVIKQQQQQQQTLFCFT